MANLENFTTVVSCSEGMKKRMKDHELVLRFLAFYHMDVQKESFTNIAELLNNMMTVLNKSTQEQHEQWGNAYNNALSRSYSLFGERAFEKSFNRRVRKNTPLYEVWTVCLARLSEKQWQRILPHRQTIVDEHQDLVESDLDYNRAITYATQKKEHVEIRYKIVNNILQKHDPEH